MKGEKLKNPELIEIAYNRLIEKGLIGIYSVYDIGNSIVASEAIQMKRYMDAEVLRLTKLVEK